MDFSSFIGKNCLVISKQNIRYSGTLQLIDPVERKLRITDVHMHGTEDRPTEVFMPPMPGSLGLVEFPVNDLKDLRFDDDGKPSTAPAPSAPPSQPPQQQYSQPTQPQQKPLQPTAPPASFSAEKALPPGFSVYQANTPTAQAAVAPNGSGAAPNTDTLNHAMGAMNLNNAGAAPRTNGAHTGPHPGRGMNRGRGRGRGGRHDMNHHHHNPHHQQSRVEIKIPASDFDFEASNKLFDKDSAAKQYLQQPYAGATFNSSPAEKEKEKAAGRISPAVVAAAAAGTSAEKVDGESVPKEKVYNPKASFFDTLSSDLTSKKPARPTEARSGPTASGSGAQEDGGGGDGGRGRGRGRGGASYGRMRRDEERERNVETFGEPGGVGLLGPGSYVGGYGGYRGRRRRGGGMPRGGGRGGAGTGGGGAPRAVVHTT